MIIFHYKIVRMESISNFVPTIGMNFIQILIMPDNICRLIHKKCYPKSYHNDIKYHMTLNTIFSDVIDEPL